MANHNETEQKYTEALKQIDDYRAKANAAEVAFQGCQSSASYKLGHLLIHETRSLKDVFKLFSRIKAIRGTSDYTGSKTVKKEKPVKKTYDRVSVQTDEPYKSGISIVLPTYRGEQTISRVLSSLAKQDMENELFEIIIVINGAQDTTPTVIDDFSQENPTLNIRTFTLKESGASLARNKGIEEASYQYMVLIDDDDAVSATYLSSLYRLASKESIVLSQIINIDGDKIDSSNLINMQILKADTPVNNPFKTCPSILTINACKLVPTVYMKQIKFNTDLRSGEDIVYFSELLSQFKFNFKIAKEAIYFRFIKNDSVSRQPLSFEFNIIGRLLVISDIFNFMEESSDKHVRQYIKKLINSQINFMNAYLKAHPEAYQSVVEEIEKRGLLNFPFERLHHHVS